MTVSVQMTHILIFSFLSSPSYVGDLYNKCLQRSTFNVIHELCRIAEDAGTCPICRRKMKKVRKIFTV